MWHAWVCPEPAKCSDDPRGHWSLHQGQLQLRCCSHSVWRTWSARRAASAVVCRTVGPDGCAVLAGSRQRDYCPPTHVGCLQEVSQVGIGRKSKWNSTHTHTGISWHTQGMWNVEHGAWNMKHGMFFFDCLCVCVRCRGSWLTFSLCV